MNRKGRAERRETPIFLSVLCDLCGKWIQALRRLQAFARVGLCRSISYSDERQRRENQSGAGGQADLLEWAEAGIARADQIGGEHDRDDEQAEDDQAEAELAFGDHTGDYIKNRASSGSDSSGAAVYNSTHVAS